MNRSGIRVGDLVFGDFGRRFEARFRSLVADYTDAFGNLVVDVDAELDRYRKLAEIIRPYVTETVSYLQNEVNIFFFAQPYLLFFQLIWPISMFQRQTKKLKNILKIKYLLFIQLGDAYINLITLR